MKLTQQQTKAIHHKWGTHTKIVGVPGCGKTFTLLRLIAGLNVDPKSVLVLMYNRQAKIDFKKRLAELLPRGTRPSVHTVHSYCFSVMGWMQKNLSIPIPELWGEDQSIYYVNAAINALKRDGLISKFEADYSDRECVLSAINMFKSMGVLPENAGHRFDKVVPLAYARFEEMRKNLDSMTFADFAPRVLWTAQNSEKVASKMRYRLVIVDEAQDLDWSQWSLIQFLAQQGADIVVAGDADQTLYEWRGARPEWLLKFDEILTDNPANVYPLTYNFRSGPVICQLAQNVIETNDHRDEQVLVSANADQWGKVTLVESRDSNYVLAKWIRDRVLKGTHPSQIRVLARTYAQMNGLESALLSLEVPYIVKGNDGFLARGENLKLLEYVSLAQRLSDPIDDESIDLYVSVMNVPGRMISKQTVRRLLGIAMLDGMSLHDGLMSMESDDSFFPNVQYNIGVLNQLLHNISVNLHEDAGVMLQRVVDWTNYYDHFKSYYGGPTGEDRIRSVRGFLDYAKSTGTDIVSFKEHLTSIDTTQGVKDESQLIVLTTVFQEKGCQYLYVVIPDVIEGTMPVMIDGDVASGCYDLSGYVPDPHTTARDEAERRLFYVALTRAVTEVVIGTRDTKRDDPSRFLEEMRLEQTIDIMSEVQRLKSGVGSEKDVQVAYGRISTEWAHEALKRYGVDVPEPTRRTFIKKHDERQVSRPFNLDEAWLQLAMEGLPSDERGE